MDYEYTRNRLREVFDRTMATQKDFAERCNLTQSTVTRLLSGKRSPQLVTLVKICNTFKVEPAYFVKELQDCELNATPVYLEPPNPMGTTLRKIVRELTNLDEENLAEVLEFIRFRKEQGKKKRSLKQA